LLIVDFSAFAGVVEEMPLLNDADNEELKIREEALGKEEKSKHR